MRVIRSLLPLILLAALVLPARATQTYDRERIAALIRDVSTANSPTAIDAVLRRFADEPSDSGPVAEVDAYAVVWFDNWTPRARVWLKKVDAEDLFSEILADKYLLEGVEIDGQSDIELEIRAGGAAAVEGRLSLRDADLRWKEGEFALVGVTGTIPFRRALGTPIQPSPSAYEERSIHVDTMLWAGKPIASQVDGMASYDNRILRFERLRLNVMGGNGIGSVVMDHRGQNWRCASMIRFNEVDLHRLYEILPGLPIFARVTIATLKGEVALVYEAPERIGLSGQVESIAPGVIELSPLMREVAREILDSRVIHFQKIVIDLGNDAKARPEARISLYRRTAQTLWDIFRGEPFNPMIMTVKVPLLPFVQQLSLPR